MKRDSDKGGMRGGVLRSLLEEVESGQVGNHRSGGGNQEGDYEHRQSVSRPLQDWFWGVGPPANEVGTVQRGEDVEDESLVSAFRAQLSYHPLRYLGDACLSIAVPPDQRGALVQPIRAVLTLDEHGELVTEDFDADIVAAGAREHPCLLRRPGRLNDDLAKP